MTATDLAYDPYDYAIDADPYPVWKRLRDEAPLYWNEQHGFYALSRYDDVLDGLLDTQTFQSSHGILLEMITDEPFDVPMMIMMDPPEHTRLRKLVSRAFTPRRIADLEGKITAICAGFLDPLRDHDEFDYIDTFAGLLPPTVILALLGFPEGHAAAFRASADAAMHLEEGTTMSGAVRPGQSLVSASGELGSEAFAMLPDLMEAQRRKPEDDLISIFANAKIDGEPLPFIDQLAYAFIIVVAGNEGDQGQPPD